MKILISIAFFILISRISFPYDSISSFEDDWKNWQDEWQNSVTSNNGGIQFSKRIDQDIGQPFTMPDINSLEPDFGPYGINWQDNLSMNSIGKAFSDYYNHLSWIFSPDNIDILISAAGADILSILGQQYSLEQINHYMQLAQGYDNLMTTIQNHRYELARYMWDLSLSNKNSTGHSGGNDIFYNSAESNLYSWETNINAVIRGKIIDNYSDNATALINYLSSSGSDKFTESYPDQTFIYRVDSIIRNIQTIYGASLDNNNKVSTKSGLESVMHDTASIFQKYCIFIINKKQFDDELNRFSIRYASILNNNKEITDNIPKLKLSSTGSLAIFRKITREFMYDVYHDMIITTIAQINGISGIIKDSTMRTRAEKVCNELRNALTDNNIYFPPGE